MKGFLAALLIVAAIVLGLGFYRGWFTFGVDQEKIHEDKESAKEKVKKLWPAAKDKTGTPADGGTDASTDPSRE
jgi:hypothetical protein